MISILTTTNRYILQPSLLDMHHQSLDWLSAILLWKKELNFFQKLLGQHSSYFASIEDKKQIGHFQSLITYYNGEVADTLRTTLLDHEKTLAVSLKSLNEANTQYYTEHRKIIEDLSAFESQYIKFKKDFFAFVERAL